MKNSSVNISGKLNAGLIELYTDLSAHAQALDIDVLVVGAMARDLVLVFGYGARIERGTRDVDFGISVASWDETRASAVKLGKDTGAIASPEAVKLLRKNLFEHPSNRALFVRDMLDGQPLKSHNEDGYFDLLVGALLSESARRAHRK